MERAEKTVGLIGFQGDSSDHLGAALASCGYKIIEAGITTPGPEELVAIFVCADTPGWLETICEVRATYGRTLLIVATQEPNYGKWLDALEAGAHDYCCTSATGQQFSWLLRREAVARRNYVRADRIINLYGSASVA